MSFFKELITEPAKFYPFLGAAAAVSLPLIVNTCKDFYFDIQKRKTEKDFITVQLIFLLDNFAFKCGEVAWDQGFDPSFPEPNEHEYESQALEPEFDMSTIKGEHKYLNPLLLYKLQSINVEIAKSKDSLREIINHPNFDYSDLPGYYSKRRKNFARIGLYALDISDELRGGYNIPYREDWNPRNTIQDSLNNMWRLESIRKIKYMESRAKKIMSKHRKGL